MIALFDSFSDHYTERLVIMESHRELALSTFSCLAISKVALPATLLVKGPTYRDNV